MQIHFHSHLCSYLSRVPILVEGTVYIFLKCNIFLYGLSLNANLNVDCIYVTIMLSLSATLYAC